MSSSLAADHLIPSLLSLPAISSLVVYHPWNTFDRLVLSPKQSFHGAFTFHHLALVYLFVWIKFLFIIEFYFNFGTISMGLESLRFFKFLFAFEKMYMFLEQGLKLVFVDV